jgi:predicted Rossmann fold flavoprotein
MNIKEKKSFDVLVIGGGAAGMMAAITAASNGADTVILEHKDRVGKKILSTGNGKCNYTNEKQGVSYYRGDNPAFVVPVMEQFGFAQTIEFFQRLGIYPKNKNGYYYPASEQAASVLDVLRMELSYRRVSVVTECEVTTVEEKKNGFVLETGKGRFFAKKIIFATGLLAAPKTGSDGSAIPLIKAFGHRFSDVVPALVALQCKENYFKQLAGIRTEASVTLDIDGREPVSDRGELQLTDYGISGIPVFQVSRFVTKALKKKQKVTATVDFLPSLSGQEAAQLLTERFHENAHGKSAGEAMIGLLNHKLSNVLLKEARIHPDKRADEITQEELLRLVKQCKQFTVSVIGSKSFEQAQVCAGGVHTGEINPETMESANVPNVYFAGEVVDIDGMCGGYNLQWAWSSGYVAGKHAALSCENRTY